MFLKIRLIRGDQRADNKFESKDIYGKQTMSVPKEVFDSTKDLLRSIEQHFAKIADNDCQAKQKDVLSVKWNP